MAEPLADELRGAGIDLAFPTRTVLLHDQTEDADGDRARQREGWPAGRNPPEPRRAAKTGDASPGDGPDPLREQPDRPAAARST